MCTDLEKTIYNEHLKESRRSKNKPYKIRKNFTKISESTKLILKRLSNLFIKRKEINISDFIRAPYSVYSESEIFPLKFYTTQKAILVYKIYTESKKSLDMSNQT
jgi:hypothetical protein